jgi:hypothetical protein
MPKRPAADLYIYKKGVFDLNSLYKTIRTWFTKNRYTPFEKVYKDKPGDPTGRELVDEWMGQKKVTGYIRFNVYVDIKGWNLVDVEVPVGDKKVKRQSLRIRVRVWSELETDWEKRFENPVLEKVRNFYEKYILKKELETKWEAQLFGETYDLHGRLKQLLELEAEKNV